MWTKEVPNGGVESMAFSSEGAILYTGDSAGWITAWNRAADEQRKLFRLQGNLGSGIWQLAVTATGPFILAGTTTSFVVWDGATEETWSSKLVPAKDFRFALAVDDRTVASVREDNSSIAFWDLSSRGLNSSRPHVPMPDRIEQLAFSPADATLAVVDSNGGLSLIEPGAAGPTRINSTAREQRIDFSDWGHYLTFSADGRTLAVGSGRSVVLWDVATRQRVRTIKAGRALVRYLAVHPNGKRIASAGDTPLVSLWDADTGKQVAQYDWGIGSKVQALAFAPDGMTVAAGGSNRKLVVWDLDDN